MSTESSATDRARMLARSVRRSLGSAGLDVPRLAASSTDLGRVLAIRREFVRQWKADPDGFALGSDHFVLGEGSEQAGQASGHYFHQDLLVAREIHRRNPRRHVDVGSSVYGFVSHVASFRAIEVLDIRRQDSTVDGITFHQQDLLDLDPAFRRCADSVSCLHALEHVGLGRYGDRVDSHGWRAALAALAGMVIPGGTLYVGVPTGRIPRVEFNAHRVFSVPILRAALIQFGVVERLAMVLDDGSLVDHIEVEGPDADRSLDAHYGCSIWVVRISDQGR